MTKIRSFYYFLKGQHFYHLGYYTQALKAFEEALKIHPTNYIYRYKYKTLKHLNNFTKYSYGQENQKLREQVSDIKDQLQTLQKQMFDLNTNSTLKDTAKIFNDFKTENSKDTVSNLQQETDELRPPTYKDTTCFSDQFVEMQDDLKKLQGQVYDLEESDKITQEDRNQLKQNTELLQNHNFILQDTMDKAKMKEDIKLLEDQDPLLSLYYKTFYWTLLNFFHAHCTLSTELFTYNTNYAHKPQETLANNTKTAFDKINIITKHLPVIGNFTEVINNIINEVYNITQNKKLKNITSIISNISQTYNTIEELQHDLTNSAFFITNSKKEQILNFARDFDNNLSKPNKNFLFKIKSFKKLMNSEYSNKSINDKIIKLAVQDTILLICELLNNTNINICTELILQHNNFKTPVEVTTNNIPMFEEHIKIIGSTIAFNKEIFIDLR
ncbi:MAG TPA: tetratricopeptide repeat protein [Rickettsia endosymbiont of Pyrocoelia pectoralis]|nr:tetratricopeptide repeat protein [Rickettsia endosymbiont of Pyrocoelia pectoralis]